MVRSKKSGAREFESESRKVSVSELAKRLSCSATDLYREIDQNHWGEMEGVYNPLPSKGKRGIRIDEWQFLHRRQMSPNLLGDQRLLDANKTFLSIALPMRTFLERFINEAYGQYEAASARMEAGGDQQTDGLDKQGRQA